MSASVTGVILAGGESRRMGSNKALLQLGGRPMIAVVADRLRPVVQEVIIAAADAELYSPYADRWVNDAFPGVGVLGGIHAGLEAATHELALVVGCDMPLIDEKVARWFVWAAESSPSTDVVVLRDDKGIEPLHAVYRRTCRPAIEEAIRSGRRRVISFFDQVRVRYVEPAELIRLDPDLRSFRNTNTPEEWRELLRGVEGDRLASEAERLDSH